MSPTTQNKKDLLEIINNALAKFAEELIKPSFEVVFEKLEEQTKRLSKIESKLENHDQNFTSLERKTDLIAEKITSHEKRIHALEISSQTS